MQWIYIILFTLTLLVPQLVRPEDFPAYPHEHVESAAIFLLGIIGFSVSYFRERIVKRHIEEKKKYQREASHASRDLVHSYSYIGEVNRQLEVLKKIALGVPEKQKKVTKKQRHILFNDMLEAITMFARTENATVHFVDMESQTIAFSLKIGETLLSLSAKELLEQKKEAEEYANGCVVSLMQPVAGYRVFLVLDRNNISQENKSFLKAVLSQALAVFVRSKE